jgi:hypothetical protein
MNAMADPAPAPGAAEALAQLQEEIQSVEKDIAANERWEGGRPCGAEAQRARLASLTECLTALTGGTLQKVGRAADAFVTAASGGKFEGGGSVRRFEQERKENANPNDQ